MPSSALVLVVDDQDPGRFAKVSILRRAGFDVTEAATGRDALQQADALGPDVVVLDVNLPDINGFEVCRQLKARPSAAQVLQLSATAMKDQDRIAGLASGADTYLVEPIAPEILVATTHALLRVKRSEQALAALAERERTAREEAERANRAKDDFLAMLSHELRTPLNAMNGWVWQMNQRPDDAALRTRALDGLARAVRMQARLIDDLLDISRIEKGKVELSLRVLDLRTLVVEAVDAARQRAPGRAIELELPTQPVHVNVDRERMTQVVSNLLNNAVQYTPDYGHIAVAVCSDGGGATLRVTDTGAGIDPEFLPVVFEAFKQGDGTSRHTHGLGVGLAIVKRLVALHGGTVETQSAGRGHGATFIVRVPTVRERAKEAEPPASGDLSAARILVLDDDADARDVCRAMLEAAGARVVTAASVVDALHELERQTVTAIVSDIAMAERDGLDFLRTVRGMGVKTPAVAVSAFSAQRDRQMTSEAGFDAHVAKPLDQQRLVRTLARLIGAPPR